MADCIYYTYLHRRKDDNLPFLIGKGKDKRAWEKTNRNNWWKNVVAKHDYTVEMLKENLEEKEALAYEVEMIAYGRNAGWPLVNITNGGEGISGYRHTDETKRIVGEKSKAYAATEAGQIHLRENGRISGKKNVESGKLAYARSKNIGIDTFKSSRCFEVCSKGGKIGGKISGQKSIESGHISRLGKKNVESGWLDKIRTPEICSLGGRISAARQFGIEVEPNLWISKKTNKVIYDGRTGK